MASNIEYKTGWIKKYQAEDPDQPLSAAKIGKFIAILRWFFLSIPQEPLEESFIVHINHLQPNTQAKATKHEKHFPAAELPLPPTPLYYWHQHLPGIKPGFFSWAEPGINACGSFEGTPVFLNLQLVRNWDFFLFYLVYFCTQFERIFEKQTRDRIFILVPFLCLLPS